MDSRNVLLFLALKYQGDWAQMYDVIKKKSYFKTEEMEEVIKTNTSKFVTIMDKEYPEAFKRLGQPPFVLFYKGNFALLNDIRNNIAYIGTRNASAYGLRKAQEFGYELSSRGYHIVSGMARGIDSAAMREAIREQGRCIAVLGSGIDEAYPKSNKDLYDEIAEHGLIISEYPLNTPPSPDNFRVRNRLLAAISHGVVIGEAYPKSGTMITVRYALDLGVEVGAVPFEAGLSSINNQLIKEGAHLIENVDDAINLIK